MKILALLFLLVLARPALADPNLVQNGTFTDGITHWSGDCHSPDSSSVDLSAKPKGGVVIKLRPSEWTKVTQDFDGPSGDMAVTITFSIMPGTSFSNRAEDYVNVPAQMGVRRGGFSADPGDCVVFLDSVGARRLSSWKASPNVSSSGAQTFTHTFNLDDPRFAGVKGFYLGFPPGDGVINLQSITVVPGNGG